MSDLLNSASLVMIPSGYKEDTVYSVVPSDGSGDLQFTRSSNGTRVNSAGLVEVCPWNLILQSETFNNSYWNKVNGTITSDSIVAPNGTTTADLFTITNNSAFVEKTIAGTGTLFTFIPNTQYTFSCYFKKGSIDYNFKMLMYDGVSVTNSGTINLTTPSSSTVSYEDVGNGWYRFYHTFTSSASATTGYFYAVNYDYSTTITSGTNVYLWGAQVVQGSTAKPYFPTTDRQNVPRLTYQNGGGGCPSLLLEKQSTNYLIYNTEIDNAAWVKARSTVTANATTSPDGTQNADGVFVNSDTNTNHEVFQYGTGSTEGWSAFFKANGYNFVYLFGSADPIVWFDLQNGTVGTAQSGASGKITNYGNGWYRCEYYKNSGTNSIWGFGIVPSNGVTTIASPDTSKGVYFWGAQGEAGLYSTSMIYTTSSSATRVADACFKTGISSLIGQTEGTILLDCLILTTESQDLLSVRPGGTSALAIGTASNLILGYVLEGATVISMSFANYAINTRYKIALAYKNGDCALYVNGTQADTDSTAFTFSTALSSLYLGQSQYFGKASFQQNETVTFPTRLSNSELQALTSL